MSPFGQPASVLRRFLRARWRRYAAIALLCVAVSALSIDGMRRESVTIDEPMNLTAGYTFWSFGDYRLDDTNGVLPQRWFALPLLLMDLKFPPRESHQWRQPGYVGKEVCWNFLFASGNDPDAMVFRGRLMALVFGLAVVVAVYGWTGRVFGRGAGLFAAFLCALSPTMLAHGHLMTLDMAAALFFLMCTGCFWQLLRRLTVGRLAASAACFGLLLVTKMSAPLFGPMALILFAVRIALRRPWAIRIPGFRPRELRTLRGQCIAGCVVAAAHAIAAGAIIWCFFGWRFQPSADWNPARDAYTESFGSVMASLGSLQWVVAAIEKWRLLPEGYIFGLAHTVKHVAERHAYLNGRYSTTGWWYYFPYCFLVKTAPAILAGAAIGVGVLVWRAVRSRAGRRDAFLRRLDQSSPVWSLLLVYGVAALLTRLDIGQRHILPLYPAVFAVAGEGLWWLVQRSRWGCGVAAALLLLQIGTVGGIHPYYLSYFNPLAGGPAEGYLHLTDSNVDWGQDLPSLANWLRADGPPAGNGKVYVNCFCYDLPERWGITAYKLPYDVTNPHLSSADPVAFEPGTYCISATTLMLPGPPWNPERERVYRRQLSEFGQLEMSAASNPDDPAIRKFMADFVFKLATGQFYRLRSYLAHRKPDAMVGYSILVYRLSDSELHAALVPQ